MEDQQHLHCLVKLVKSQMICQATSTSVTLLITIFAGLIAQGSYQPMLERQGLLAGAAVMVVQPLVLSCTIPVQWLWTAAEIYSLQTVLTTLFVLLQTPQASSPPLQVQ